MCLLMILDQISFRASSYHTEGDFGVRFVSGLAGYLREFALHGGIQRQGEIFLWLALDHNCCGMTV